MEKFIDKNGKSVVYINFENYKYITEYIANKHKIDSNKIFIYALSVFDVPCGCVWNTSLIYRIKYIKKLSLKIKVILSK
jgi:hypothetical protein